MTLLTPSPFGMGAVRTSLHCFFLLLLKISWGNPYLKILDLANLCNAPTKKKKIVLPPLSTLNYRTKNCPWTRGLKSLIQISSSPNLKIICPTVKLMQFPKLSAIQKFCIGKAENIPSDKNTILTIHSLLPWRSILS